MRSTSCSAVVPSLVTCLLKTMSKQRTSLYSLWLPRVALTLFRLSSALSLSLSISLALLRHQFLFHHSFTCCRLPGRDSTRVTTMLEERFVTWCVVQVQHLGEVHMSLSTPTFTGVPWMAVGSSQRFSVRHQ